MKTDDRWIVVGPGRTGSKVIVDVLRGAYWKKGIELKYVDPISPLPNCGSIIRHSHNVVDLCDNSSRIVLSIRNCVESALSGCIQPQIGHWHLYKHRHSDQLDKIVPFFLDPVRVLEKYQSIKKFYEQAKTYLVPGTIVIDYNEFCTDPKVILDKLKLDRDTRLEYIPVKNPGTYSNWILNWEEVQQAIKDLPTRPF